MKTVVDRVLEPRQILPRLPFQQACEKEVADSFRSGSAQSFGGKPDQGMAGGAAAKVILGRRG